MPQHQKAIVSMPLTYAATPTMLTVLPRCAFTCLFLLSSSFFHSQLLFTLVVQVSRPLEWTGHLQKAAQYMASCARLPSPRAPTSPSSQNSVNLTPPPH